jgi:hypothetical protein
LTAKTVPTVASSATSTSASRETFRIAFSFDTLHQHPARQCSGGVQRAQAKQQLSWALTVFYDGCA